MRVLAQINKELILLLDTWSTHNFLSKQVARTLKIPCENHSVVKLIVASGQSMLSKGFGKQVPVWIQGIKFFIDFYLLYINDYDVVIGIQWLKLLGQIVWDLNNLKLSFTWQQKTVILHGLHSRITTLISG